MRYFLFMLIFILSAISLLTSCEPEIIEAPLPPSLPFSCENGYEPNAIQDSCVCPSPKVEILGLECYDIPPRAFYSDMAGCYLEAGVIYEITYDTSVYLSWSNVYRVDNTRYATPNPYVNQYQTNPVSAYLYENNGQWDSLRLIIEAPYNDYYGFRHPALSEGPTVTEFRGIWQHPDTIAGHFVFGYVDELSSELWAVIELERCPATLVRH